MGGSRRPRGGDRGRRRRPGQEGFTLIEALIAVVLLVVGLVGIAVSYPYSSLAVTDGWIQTTTVGLANEVIERARRIPFDSLPSFSPTLTGFPGYTRTVTVADFVDPDGTGNSCLLVGGVPNCRRVTVVVSHTTGFSASISTVFSRP